MNILPNAVFLAVYSNAIDSFLPKKRYAYCKLCVDMKSFSWQQTKKIAIESLNEFTNLKLNFSTLRNWTIKDLQPVIEKQQSLGRPITAMKIKSPLKKDYLSGQKAISYIVQNEVVPMPCLALEN